MDDKHNAIQEQFDYLYNLRDEIIEELEKPNMPGMLAFANCAARNSHTPPLTGNMYLPKVKVVQYAFYEADIPEGDFQALGIKLDVYLGGRALYGFQLKENSGRIFRKEKFEYLPLLFKMTLEMALLGNAFSEEHKKEVQALIAEVMVASKN